VGSSTLLRAVHRHNVLLAAGWQPLSINPWRLDASTVSKAAIPAGTLECWKRRCMEVATQAYSRMATRCGCLYKHRQRLQKGMPTGVGDGGAVGSGMRTSCFEAGWQPVEARCGSWTSACRPGPVPAGALLIWVSGCQVACCLLLSGNN
jgi:hypothetical protein